MKATKRCLGLVLLCLANPSYAESLWQESRHELAVPEMFTHFEKVFVLSNGAVVNISTLQQQPIVSGKDGPIARNPLEIPPLAPSGTRKNLGTGFIFNADGYIVTNHHVIQNESGIAVTTAAGKNYLAHLVGSDPFTDIAVIKVTSSSPLPTVTLGDSSQLKVGQWVLAIGNPFGFRNTMTHGILSATGRVISNEQNRKRFDMFLQVDAPINPGNSGGPLMNMEGDVVGVNTAMTATGAGIAFAVPINLVKQILGDLVRKGGVERGWIGIVAEEPGMVIEGATAKGAENLGLMILEVVPNSPAAKVGIKHGDRLLAVNGVRPTTLFELSEILANAKPGSTLALEWLRSQRLLKASVVVQSLRGPTKP